MQSVVSEPGSCCWSKEAFEGRLTDLDSKCSSQWIDHIDYCFPASGGVANDRCSEIYTGIANDDWEAIMPEGATCLDVDFRCFEPDAYDYYGTDVECIAQWKAFDTWCWNDELKDEEQCEKVNEEYEAEMERRRLILLAGATAVEGDSSTGFFSGFAIGASLTVAAVAFLAVHKCSSKTNDDF